jgi:Tol biopolymer transport system component/DNA-binding winged helix-turn-helix (wHTH) protein
MSEPSPVRFSVFELDVRNGELRKHGVLLKIQNQPLQVLQALLERPGEIMTREELQTRIWAHDTFVDFDQSLNRAINKVREVLKDDAGAPRFIETVPRRGYRFIAPVEATALPPPPSAPVARFGPHSRLGWVAACFAAITATGLWLAGDRAKPPLRIVPLTTLTGYEIMPAFSPDGKQVAFAWDGESQNNVDIYIKAVGEERLLRLTSDPATDWFPAWSPDGRRIAFSRMNGERGIYLVSPLGGPERKLTGLVTASRPSWSIDGKSLLFAQEYVETNPRPGAGAIFLIPVVNGGEPRQVLAAPLGKWYRDPAYSPDGRSLAYLSCTGAIAGPSCTLQVISLKEGQIPSGQPRPIQQYSNPYGLAWAADGFSLIYGSFNGNASYLWRIGVTGNNEAERLELPGVDAWGPAIRGGRLAFSRTLGNSDVWRLQRGGKASPFLTSSLADENPQYSPDGRRIAFSSGRGGDGIAVWVANADGTGLNQITRISNPICGAPRWSPDGNWIAFDAYEKASGWDVWVLEASSGTPRRLTHGPADNILPSWSRDGDSIYFASKRSGRFEIWRVPAKAGAEVRVTRDGGYTAFESTDGKTLYYTVSDAGGEGIYAKQLPDGDEKQAIKSRVAGRGLAIVSDGIYYLQWRNDDIFEILFHDFASQHVEVIGESDGLVAASSGLAVSPDGKAFLFSKRVGAASDLMLIENFR